MTEDEFIKNLPAFPHEHRVGMTLRDYFAAKAMQADMSTYSEDLIYETPEWFEARAKNWYAVADAMLKARGTK
jgi:hypothetical protein